MDVVFVVIVVVAVLAVGGGALMAVSALRRKMEPGSGPETGER